MAERFPPYDRLQALKTSLLLCCYPASIHPISSYAVNEFRIDFEPVGRRVSIGSNETLLSAAQQAGIALTAVCGGVGVCGACKVRLVSGDLSPLTETEKSALPQDTLDEGWRLACQTLPRSDLKIEIPPESLSSSQRLQTEGITGVLSLSPAITIQPFEIPKPNASDLRADWERFTSTFSGSLENDCVPLPVMSQFSDMMRKEGWQGQVIHHANSQIIGFLPKGKPVYGLAVDIGTTKMAAYLINLETGEIVARKGEMNPQIAFGEDVVARIAYANEGEAHRLALQKKLIDSLNGIMRELCSQVSADVSQVADLVIVGNTAMQHLFAGLPVRQLGQAPYVAAVGQALSFPATLVGLEAAPNAQAYLPPNIAGYVGADHVAMLLASDISSLPGTVVALDIGTNTEISVSKDGRLVSCSCASGPAFEGAHIHAGMRAVPGAIERARFFDGQWHLATIDEDPPVGICGSGILDIVSELLVSGQIDSAGRFTDRAVNRIPFKGGDAVELVPGKRSGTGKPIIVTRQDIREIQLAKAAIRAGVDVLLAHSSTQPDEIDHFIIAGAFGTYLSPESAIRIGMFPDLPRYRFDQIGNAAGTGARMMLLSAPSRRTAETILTRTNYIELTTEPEFMDLYVDAINF